MSMTPEQLQAQARLDAAAKESARVQAENAQKAAETLRVATKTFYNRIAGSTHVFKNGDVARFNGGVYMTDREVEITELEALVKHPGNHNITDYEVPIQNISDAIIMREVNNSQQSQVGMGNSLTSAQAAMLSRRS